MANYLLKNQKKDSLLLCFPGYFHRARVMHPSFRDDHWIWTSGDAQLQPSLPGSLTFFFTAVISSVVEDAEVSPCLSYVCVCVRTEYKVRLS